VLLLLTLALTDSLTAPQKPVVAWVDLAEVLAWLDKHFMNHRCVSLRGQPGAAV
jgi:hypothetical protein